MGAVDGVEVEVDDDVAGIIDRLLDPLSQNSRLRATVREALEGAVPLVEVGDRVLDVQGRRHRGLLGRGWWAYVFDRRDVQRRRPSQVPGFLRLPSVWSGPYARAYGRHVPDSVDYSRSAERVVRLCQSSQDARSLRLEVIEEIRHVVGFDAYAWLLTDPETSVGAAPLADVPWLPELPAQIRLKYLTPLNRWTALGSASVALLHQATGGDLSRSLVWRDLLARYDVGDAGSVVFRDPYGCWAFLELWRLIDRGPFTTGEADFLAGIARPLTSALRRCQANTFTVRAPGRPSRTGPVVLLLSPDLQVRAQTAETVAYLRELVPPAAGRPPVPAGAYNVGAQLLANEAGVDSSPPSARVHVSDGLWVTLRASRLGGDQATDGPDIAVTIEQSSPSERVDLFGRAFGLSPRERQLLGLLVTGNDTRELARRMFLSENTVQDHLKAIFAKTSARNRRTLLSRALGS